MSSKATPKQLWALYCITKINTKNLDITLENASELIGKAKGGIDIREDLFNLGCVGNLSQTQKPKQDHEKLYKDAYQAGVEAANKVNIAPMVVQQRFNPLDDNSPIKEQYIVPDGPCGFANLRIKGNTSFGRWAKKESIAKKSYSGGLVIYIHDYGQSLARKEAHAYAMAEYLRNNGVEGTYAESRMD